MNFYLLMQAIQWSIDINCIISVMLIPWESWNTWNYLHFSHRNLNWFFHFKHLEQIVSPWENAGNLLWCSSYSCVTFILTFLSLNKFSVEWFNYTLQWKYAILLLMDLFFSRNSFLILTSFHIQIPSLFKCQTAPFDNFWKSKGYDILFVQRSEFCS